MASSGPGSAVGEEPVISELDSRKRAQRIQGVKCREKGCRAALKSPDVWDVLIHNKRQREDRYRDRDPRS